MLSADRAMAKPVVPKKYYILDHRDGRHNDLLGFLDIIGAQRGSTVYRVHDVELTDEQYAVLTSFMPDGVYIFEPAERRRKERRA